MNNSGIRFTIKNNPIFIYSIGFITCFYYSLLVIFNLINLNSYTLAIWLTLSILLFLISIYFINSISTLLENDFGYFALIIGFIIGVILSLSQPNLSSDLYRYLFDGYLLNKGYSPYQYAPNSPVIANVVKGFPWLSLINHAQYTDEYPPVMLFFTWMIILLTGTSVFLWKIVMTILVLCSGFIIRKLLAIFNKNPIFIILWSWNPIVLLEFSENGHNDIIGIFLFLLAVLFLYKSNNISDIQIIVSSLFWVLSIGCKFFPILMIPFFLKRLKRVGFISTSIFLILLSILVLSIQIYSGSSILDVVLFFRFNGMIYEFLTLFISTVISTFANVFNSSFYLNITTIRFFVSIFLFMLTSLLIIIYLLIFYFFIKKGDNYLPFFLAGIAFFTFLLLSPSLHPWYVIWSLPLFMLTKPRLYSFWVLNVMILFSYLFYVCLCENMLFLFLEFIPVYIFLIKDLINFITFLKEKSNNDIRWNS